MKFPERVVDLSRAGARMMLSVSVTYLAPGTWSRRQISRSAQQASFYHFLTPYHAF
jgi:hypothetical protein